MFTRLLILMSFFIVCLGSTSSEAITIKLHGSMPASLNLNSHVDFVATSRIPFFCMHTSWVNPPQPKTRRLAMPFSGENGGYATKLQLDWGKFHICNWYSTMAEFEIRHFDVAFSRVTIHPNSDVKWHQFTDLREIQCNSNQCRALMRDGTMTFDLVFALYPLPNEDIEMEIPVHWINF